MSRHHHSVTWGIILILLGVLFLLKNFGYVDVGDLIHEYWPLILILIGVKMLIDNRGNPQTATSARKKQPDEAEAPGGDVQNHSRVAGDIDLRFDGQEIRRFTGSTVFGNIRLDFSGAIFTEQSELHLSTVFGDTDIQLPAGVNVEARMSNVAGSIKIYHLHDDGFFKTITFHSPDAKPGKPPVRIKASVVFGDIRVS